MTRFNTAPSRKARLLLPGLLLGIVLTVVGASAARADIHMPHHLNFCGEETAIVEATICNIGGPDQFYSMRIEPGSFPGCGELVAPAVEFLTPNPVFVAADECVTVRMRVSRPPELDVCDTIFYWTVFTPAEQGGVSWQGTEVIDRFLCIDWYFEEFAVFVHPEEPVTFEFEIFNPGDFTFELPFIIEARDASGEIDLDVISINGNDPGQFPFESVEIPAQESVLMSFEATWLQPEASGFYDLVLITENTFEDFGAIGIHPTVDTPAGVFGPSKSGELGAVIDVFPNPSTEVTVLSLCDTDGGRILEATIFDVHGRRVRELLPSTGSEHGRLVWDGLDDSGELVRTGSYWARVRTDQAVGTQRILRTSSR